MPGEITGTVYAKDPFLEGLFGTSFNNTIDARNSTYNANTGTLGGATGINSDGSPNLYGNDVDTAVSRVDQAKLEEWLAAELAKDAENTTLSPEQRLQRHIANLARAGQAVGMSANDIAGTLNSVMADAGVTDSNFTAESLSNTASGGINTSTDGSGLINYSVVVSAADAAADSSAADSAALDAGEASAKSATNTVGGSSSADLAGDSDLTGGDSNLAGDLDTIAGDLASDSTGYSNDQSTYIDANGTTWQNMGKHPVSLATIWQATDPSAADIADYEAQTGTTYKSVEQGGDGVSLVGNPAVSSNVDSTGAETNTETSGETPTEDPSKVTAAGVADIIAKIASGLLTVAGVAAKYGVTEAAVQAIVDESSTNTTGTSTGTSTGVTISDDDAALADAIKVINSTGTGGTTTGTSTGTSTDDGNCTGGKVDDGAGGCVCPPNTTEVAGVCQGTGTGTGTGDVCPVGTDKEGTLIPSGQTVATFCNNVTNGTGTGTITCPVGTDKEGTVIPSGQTAATFCNNVTNGTGTGTITCPVGTDKAGTVIPSGQTAATFCNNVTNGTGTTTGDGLALVGMLSSPMSNELFRTEFKDDYLRPQYVDRILRGRS